MPRIPLAVSIILILFVQVVPLQAQELEVIRSTQFDAVTIAKGYTLESSDGLMRLGIRPSTLNVATRVDIKTLDPSIMAETLPDDKTLLGSIYLFDILNKSSYTGEDFFFLEIKYPQAWTTLTARRKIYYYNGVKADWEELPSTDRPDEGSVRALIHLPYARLAIFSAEGGSASGGEDLIPETGKASWYAYKKCDCTASPDYPKGTKLLVTRLDDPSRHVVVTVNDYGPDRSLLPDRIIDLDSTAFKKLGHLSAGVLWVSVYPL